MAAVTVTGFGIQTGTDRTVYATWSWPTKWAKNTKEYSVKWYYYTGDKNNAGDVWFIGDNSSTKEKQATYTAPSNATKVSFIVKPISETHKVNDKDTVYWTASWSTKKVYDFINNIPTTPSAPNIGLNKYTLTVSLENVDTDATTVQFQILKNNVAFNTGEVKVEGDYRYAQYSCSVDAGSEYKARCRGVRKGLFSGWSEYSEKVSTIPATPAGFTECKAKTSTSVYLEWDAVNTASSYDIEFATVKDYFDSSDKTTIISGIETTRYEKLGLESGDEYFFRLRATNGSGSSSWSPITSVIVGKAPEAPTTWSSTTTATVGEPLTLYWVHNSEDGSSQTVAELEIFTNGSSVVHTIQNSTEEDEKDKTSQYALSTNEYEDGAVLQWRVRTAGATGVYGEWSSQRRIEIYAPPTLTLTVVDSDNTDIVTSGVLTSFPFKIEGTAGPSSQTAIGYHLSITSNETYEDVDRLGNAVIINKGDTLYSRYFDKSRELSVTLSANDVSLENNISYKITCLVSMNSGLTAENSANFVVAWTDSHYDVNCMLYIDQETFSAAISPYCEDENGDLVENVTLAVYRREFDGSFTEILSGIENVRNTFVTDPHPALDYARYRIVATSKTTGQVVYYDVPAYPVGGTSVIIQWNEQWSEFDVDTDEILASPAWSGSMLKLKYNIDVSDKTDKDVVLVEYAGRENPVSYHGTQIGLTSTWKTDIPSSDKDTIYALRRLQRWMGDVYVREPSGSGYWAVISVDFSIKHCETTIPVNINVTRVEGGI